MRLGIIILLTTFIICFIVFNSESITFQATESKKIDTQFHQSLEPLSPQNILNVQKSTQKEGPQDYGRTVVREQTYINYYQQDRIPIIIDNYILSNNIDCYFKNDTISILISVTNAGDKSLEDIDIYEIVPENMYIINCSIPVKTSSIDEILRYERERALILCAEDLSDPKGLAEKLIRKEPLPCHLENIISDNFTLAYKNRPKMDEVTAKEILLKELNHIINNRKLYNQIEKSNQKYLSTQSWRLLSLNIKNELVKDDSKLLNFFILRDLYPCYIKKPDRYMEIPEKVSVDKTVGIIHILIPSILPKESLMFRYYANITCQGNHRAITLVRIKDDKYPDYRFPLDIVFPSPKFNVRAVLSKVDFKPNDPIYINYIIELFSPTNISPSYKFKAYIEYNDHNISTIDNKNEFDLQFLDGKTYCNNSTTIKISRSGSYSIPTLIIEDDQYFVFLDKYINIEEPWHKYIAELSLIFLALCTVIAPNLFRFFIDIKYKFLFTLLSFLTITFLIVLSEIPIIYFGIVILLYLLYMFYLLILLRNSFEKSDQSKP